MEYRFDEIAYNSTAKKLPEDSDRQYYIGLEHLDSNSLYVSRWGSDVTPVGEKLLMKKGDVLFGKRRAYQRKVGIAPFDGIFSAHGMVLRPKENVMDTSYFPFFISSDQFMERAVRISVGGLSPTINWKDLKEQVFDIPTLEEQKTLASKLWAAYKLREEYKRLLTATDEMVKSRFIEMFGTPENNHRCFPITNLGKLCEIVGRIGFRGYTRNDLVENECDGAISLSPSNIIDGELDYTNCTYVSWEKYNESPEIMINEGDIVLVKTASVGKCALVKILPHETTINPQFVVLKQLQINPFYLNTCLQGDYGQRCIKSYTSGSTIPTFTQKQLATMAIIVPPYEKQKEFEVIIRQSDKSKFTDFKSRFIEMTSVWNKRGVIQDIVDVNIAKAGKQFAKSDIIQYIDISSVDSETNQVTTTTEYKLSDAPSRAQQCTKHGDILVSTVRPNLKNIAVNQLFGDNMVASSGFCVLRPKVGCQGLLLAYVLSEPFTKKMVAEAKGSNYPAIHDSDVLSYPVMIPSESELEKVDCFMKQADKSKYLS